MSTQSERRASGIDTLRTLSGGAFDPERSARAMVRRNGALGSFGVDHVLGTIWNRPALGRRDRSLVVVSFLASLGDGAAEELGFHAQSAVNHGLSREQVDEIVLQVAGYAGFPMAMAASRVINDVWRVQDGVERLPMKAESEHKDDPARWSDANAVRSLMFGGRNAQDPAVDRRAIADALGGVGEMAFDFAFGELWARDVLSRRDRSMVTVAILAMSRCLDELRIHLRIALNHGCTREELNETMVQLSAYRGFPTAVECAKTARAVFARLDAKR